MSERNGSRGGSEHAPAAETAHASAADDTPAPARNGYATPDPDVPGGSGGTSGGTYTIEAADTSSDDAEESDEENPKKPAVDPVRNETVNILADLVELSKTPRTAAK